MKFTFVMPYFIKEDRGGGAEVQAWFLARELASRDFTVSYICQSVTGKAGQVENVEGVKLCYLPHAAWFKWGNAVRLFRYLKKCKPDWVVQRMTSLDTGVVGLYCRMYKKKFAWICTDNESPYRWKHLNEQVVTHRQHSVRLLKRSIFLLQAFLADLMRQAGMRWVTVSFTQNQQQEKLLREQFGLDSTRMVSGQEPPVIFPDPGDKLIKPIVLWAASLSRRKRPEQFIELARLSRDNRVRYMMIGGHPDRAYTARLFENCPDNLEWLGHLSFSATLDQFDRAAIFVNTSEKEGYPNTFVQAWFRGVPVVSLGVDPDGVIRQEGLGLVVTSLDEMVAGIKKILSEPEIYLALSRRVVKYSYACHTIDRMTDHFLRCIGIDHESRIRF